MPFVNQEQRAACWDKWNQAKKQGVKPKWNCPEWEKDTPKHLPSKRCSKRCKSGKQCKRATKNGKKRCWQHE